MKNILKRHSPHGIIILLLMLCTDCSQYDTLSSPSQDLEEKFFQISSRNKERGSIKATPEGNILYFMDALKTKNREAEFVTTFIDRLGLPLWDCYGYFYTYDGDLIFLVPVKSLIYPKEINTLWVFAVKRQQNKVKYHLYHRWETDGSLSKTWVFDYFTINVLGEKPESGLSFGIKARNEGEMHCVHSYIEIGGEIFDKGWHCWEDAGIEGDTDDSWGDYCEDCGGNGEFGYDDSFLPESGGGNGSDAEKIDPDKIDSPCNRAQALSQDNGLVARVKEVYSKTFSSTNSLEQGFIRTSSGEIIYPGRQASGSILFKNEQLAGKEIIEWYHSHPTGSMITSPTDLKALAIRYQQGHIQSEDFTYGVVSEFGCLTLMISSPSDFDVFATKMRNDELEGSWKDYVPFDDSGGVEKRIGQLLKFLQKNNSGLSLMYSPTIEGGNPIWKAKELDLNADMIDMNCNQ
ncbi:hypothetical protein [Phocaeicola sp.]